MREKIIVFGRGRYFNHKKEAILNNSEIVAFIDNAVEDEEYIDELGVYVYHPSRILDFPKLSIYCAVRNPYDMISQLLESGVETDRIKLCYGIKPYFLPDEQLLNERFDYNISNKGILFKSDDGGEYIVKNENDLNRMLRETYKRLFPVIETISQLPTVPVSRKWGIERGTAVDRYYIETFLKNNEDWISGEVAEIASDGYIKKYGNEKVCKRHIYHVEGWNNTEKVNLETGEGIKEGLLDCFICTQTMQYIYDLRAAVSNVYKLLKHGGIALITVPGIANISLNDENYWGDYWRFTKSSLKRLFMESFEESNIEVSAYGNVKIAMAYLYGLCIEEINEKDFEYNDAQYPFLLTIKVQK